MVVIVWLLERAYLTKFFISIMYMYINIVFPSMSQTSQKEVKKKEDYVFEIN